MWVERVANWAYSCDGCGGGCLAEKWWGKKNRRYYGARHIFEAKYKKYRLFGPLFARSNVEKLHGAAGKSSFANQNIQKTPFSDHFLKLGSGKIAHNRGTKHIFKLKHTKHTMFGALL